MNFAVSFKQALNKTNALLDKAARHPLMDKIEQGLKLLSLNRLKSKISSAIDRIGSNPFIGRQVKAILKQLDLVAQSKLVTRLEQYAMLVRLNKPIGILLLLWPTLMALWIAAEGFPDAGILLIFVAGVTLMRSAGCAVNDFADRHIDGSVARTDQRPLVTGKVSEKEALLIFAVLAICAFTLVLLLNRLTIMLSFVGVALAGSYPFMKRYHYLPQVHLGAAFAWAVPMAFTAQANEMTPVTWLLFLATLLWTTTFDTMYAMVDREDDLKIGVKSTAILFGSLDKIIIGIIQIMLIFCLLIIGQRAGLSGFYYTGVAVAAVLAAWQQYLIKDRDPALCFKAFLNNNWLGLVLFAGLVLDYQFKGIT